MEISEPKRLPLPVRQDPSSYDELRNALNMLDVDKWLRNKSREKEESHA